MLYGTIISDCYVDYPKDCIWNPDAYFDPDFRLGSLKNPVYRRIVETIDRNAVKIYPEGEVVMTSPIFGSMAMREISTGAKTMILAYDGSYGTVLSEHIGSNCFSLLAELAEERDIHIYITHTPYTTFPIYVTNVGEVINDWYKLSLLIPKFQKELRSIED